MNQHLLKLIEEPYLRADLPDFRAGDTINVHVLIKEGNRERTQVYTGVVIQIKGTGINKTMTVRKISNGVGVERIFPVHSPTIEKIEVVKSGKVRRARIYYLRKRFGKKARIRSREVKPV